MRLPLSGEQQKTYHRKASSEDKTIFDCLIPNFQTQEAYIFTWVDSITTSGSPVGLLHSMTTLFCFCFWKFLNDFLFREKKCHAPLIEMLLCLLSKLVSSRITKQLQLIDLNRVIIVACIRSSSGAKQR